MQPVLRLTAALATLALVAGCRPDAVPAPRELRRVTVPTSAVALARPSDTLVFVTDDAVVRSTAVGEERLPLKGNPCAPTSDPLSQKIGSGLAVSPDGRVVLAFAKQNDFRFCGRDERIAIACAADFVRGDVRALGAAYPALGAFESEEWIQARLAFGASGRLYVWRTPGELRVVDPSLAHDAALVGLEYADHCEIAEPAGGIVVACLKNASEHHPMELLVVGFDAAVWPPVERARKALPLAPGRYVDAAALDDDGNRLAFSSRTMSSAPSGESELVSVDLRTGVSVRLADGKTARWGWSALAFHPATGDVMAAEAFGPLRLFAPSGPRRSVTAPSSVREILPASGSGAYWLVEDHAARLFAR